MRTKAFVIGASFGATVAYFLDPDHGRRRRARLRDRFSRGTGTVRELREGGTRDIAERAYGVRTLVRSWIRGAPLDDRALTERIRAEVSRVASEPGAVHVDVLNGRVTLSGQVSADEFPAVMNRVCGSRGVTGIEDWLEVLDEPGNGARLQRDSRRRADDRPKFSQRGWSPAERFLGAFAGGRIALRGLRRGGTLGLFAVASGMALFARAATNTELKRLLGVDAHRSVDIYKTVRIAAPVERVFELWSNFERFPDFMAHVQNVRSLDDQRGLKCWRWTIDGPAQTPVEFDTVITAYDPNRLIAWRTEPGGLVQHAGIVRFRANADGTTIAELRMSVNPIAGVIGHAAAKMLRSDPEHRVEDDLMRMKTFIETGVRPLDAARSGSAMA